MLKEKVKDIEICIAPQKRGEFRCFVVEALKTDSCVDRLKKIIYAIKILDAGISESALKPMFSKNEEDLAIAKKYWRGKEKIKE